MNLKYILITLLTIPTVLSAQNAFDASIVFGTNASQIQGDLLAGYDKLGLTGGVRVAYEINPYLDASIELLYSQRGSQNGTGTIDKISIDLQYLEIPLIASFKDWYDEDMGYYRVRADVGLSYGNLFSSTLSENALPLDGKSLITNDVSYIIGAGFMFTSRWGASLRYTRSINRLYKDANSDNPRLEGYFLTFRAEYRL